MRFGLVSAGEARDHIEGGDEPQRGRWSYAWYGHQPVADGVDVAEGNEALRVRHNLLGECVNQIQL